jgi:hypothetical protein
VICLFRMVSGAFNVNGGSFIGSANRRVSTGTSADICSVFRDCYFQDLSFSGNGAATAISGGFVEIESCGFWNILLFPLLCLRV